MSNIAVSNELFKQIIVATVNFHILLNQKKVASVISPLVMDIGHLGM